ncbi:hypothetical protein [Thalassospira sp. A3_1]|uniref:hypothetical protein n=1 Tax=Thalassospira sp. A3_1 TaxID=2821088 RepID=UPI001ADA1E6E|nr:hypothetical protein [Thalassospira sp. A3_1]MBO9508352.1 hypothetical protein [Thalassospira sp. A3_1]
MLANFILEQDSISMDHTGNARDKKLALKCFVKTWQKFGILVTTPKGKDIILNELKKNPSTLEFLKNISKSQINLCEDNVFDGFYENEPSHLRYKSLTSLALVTELTAIDKGLNDDSEFSILSDDIEITPIQNFDQSNVINSTAENQVSTISQGTRTSTIWEERFSPLEKCFKKWVIVDRYAGINIFDNSRKSGLQNIIEKLNNGSTSHTLEIFTAHQENQKIEEIVDRIQHFACPNIKLKNIIIHMGPDSIFPNNAHDRYIRHEHFVTYIGIGVSIFSGETCNQRSSISFTLSPRNFSESLSTEQHLREKSETEKLQF